MKDDERDELKTLIPFRDQGFALELRFDCITVYTLTTPMRPPMLAIYLAFCYQSEARQAPPVARFCHHLHVYACILRILMYTQVDVYIRLFSMYISWDFGHNTCNDKFQNPERGIHGHRS